jgi:hypothetical protein
MVPLKNKLISAALLFFAGAAAFAAPRPVVTNISAAAGTGKYISVSWTLPQNSDSVITSLLIFRDLKPIASYSQLSELKPAAELTAGDTGWVDSAEDYADYYYAVIAVTGRGRYDIIIPSMNATVNGVHRKLRAQDAAADASASAKEKLYPQGTMRETPLPSIDLLEEMNAPSADIGKDARDQAALLAGTRSPKKTQTLDVYVFEDDLVSPDGGDDYFLFDALRTTFIRKKYAESVSVLKKLLGTNRSENVVHRATFYLGESYYFNGNYAEAVKTFLTVSDTYPVLAKKWIDSSLDFMALPVQ